MSKVENKTVISGRLSDDGEAMSLALDELGWVGINHDGIELEEKRQYLSANNGISGLEILDPEEVVRVGLVTRCISLNGRC